MYIHLMANLIFSSVLRFFAPFRTFRSTEPCLNSRVIAPKCNSSSHHQPFARSSSFVVQRSMKIVHYISLFTFFFRRMQSMAMNGDGEGERENKVERKSMRESLSARYCFLQQTSTKLSAVGVSLLYWIRTCCLEYIYLQLQCELDALQTIKLQWRRWGRGGLLCTFWKYTRTHERGLRWEKKSWKKIEAEKNWNSLKQFPSERRRLHKNSTWRIQRVERKKKFQTFNSFNLGWMNSKRVNTSG